MITYNELYEILRKERYSETLQPLPKNFLEDIAEYLKNKKEFSDKQEDLFSDLAIKNKKKFENAIVLFKEVILRRRKKILQLSFIASETGISKKDFENLMPFEKELFETIAKSLEKSEKTMNSMLTGTPQEQQQKKHRLARFLESVSELMTMEGEAIGPFEKGEVANLEKEIADILFQDKKIEIIEEE